MTVAVRRALALLAIDRAADALQVVGEGLRENPEDADLLTAAAWAHIELDDLPSALRSVEQAIALSPDREWPHRLRSIVLQRLGKLDDALKEALEAVRLAPEDGSPLRHLFAVQREMKAYDDMWRTVALLLKFHPEDAETYSLMGLAHLDRNEWSAAEVSFRRALQLDPESSKALNNLGVALQRQKKNKEAIDAFYAAGRAEPRDEVARKNLRSTAKKYLSTGGFIGALLWVLLQGTHELKESPLKLTDDQQTWIMFAGFVAALVGYYIHRRKKELALSDGVRTYVADVARAQRRRLTHIALGPLAAAALISVVVAAAVLASDRSRDAVIAVIVCVAASAVCIALWWRTRGSVT